MSSSHGHAASVALLGARMHYAVPRLLAASGLLERLFTDICATKGIPRLLSALPDGLLPRAFRRLRERDPAGVPRERVTAFTPFGFEYARRRSSARSPEEATGAYLWGGQTFGGLVVRHGLGDAGLVYTFNSAGLEILRAARSRGIAAVVEQTIAPRQVEEQILAEERARFPAWEGVHERDALAAAFAERERAEWDQADLILCGSEFVRDGIDACGGPAAKCTVVPYGVSPPVEALRTRPDRSGPLRVLTVGAVGLRKGSPYVVEAAKRLAGLAQFRMVGSLTVAEPIAVELRRHVELTGPIARSAMSEQYAWADVFLLPSLCEGSATVTYEALAYGLPVVCTPNVGSLVRDGVDGFIVQVRDVEAIVSHLQVLAADRGLRQQLASHAVERSAEGSLEAYGRRLLGVLSPLVTGETG